MVLTEGEFTLQGTFGNVRRCFGCHDWGRGCYWHLISTDQRYYFLTYNTHDSLSQQRTIGSQMTVMLGQRTPLPFLWFSLTHDNLTFMLQLSPLNYVCFSLGKTHGAKSKGQFYVLVILRVSAALDKDDRGLVLETFSLSSSRTPHFPGLCQLPSFHSLLCWIF